MRRLLPLLIALALGIGAGVGVTLALQPASSSQWITLPTAAGPGGGEHVVDPLDCRPLDPGYSGRAVCSWVTNP